ncbi:MAG: glycosyltransferase, partial [Actinomycetota bacterium]
NVLLASEPMAFAEAVTRLLDDAALRESLGAAGREFVTRNYTWSQAAAKLEAVYTDIVNRK